MIALVRIDDRLIHGQVVLGWTKRFSIDHIMAIDDEVANNPIQAKLMKLATPVGCSSDVLTVAQAIEALQSEKLAKKKVFIVSKGAKELLALQDAGIELPETVNVGNVRQKDGKTVISYILINENDLENWFALSDHVKLNAQLTPDQTSYDLNDALNKMR
ncbi:MAG: PTS sugar transporter subunit IIB [Erysipelotrichaceae bacterium]|nr:PTS sugar transporter subunit IIB [Erysipelotrichaceae bacterium]